jgi:hypothetical protein
MDKKNLHTEVLHMAATFLINRHNAHYEISANGGYDTSEDFKYFMETNGRFAVLNKLLHAHINDEGVSVTELMRVSRVTRPTALACLKYGKEKELMFVEKSTSTRHLDIWRCDVRLLNYYYDYVRGYANLVTPDEQYLGACAFGILRKASGA